MTGKYWRGLNGLYGAAEKTSDPIKQLALLAYYRYRGGKKPTGVDDLVYRALHSSIDLCRAVLQPGINFDAKAHAIEVALNSYPLFAFDSQNAVWYLMTNPIDVYCGQPPAEIQYAQLIGKPHSLEIESRSFYRVAASWCNLVTTLDLSLDSEEYLHSGEYLWEMLIRLTVANLLSELLGWTQDEAKEVLMALYACVGVDIV